ncbi:MAG: YfhO family protein, partial [Clostridia bacterium]|nr:YfhO family protein [Clostridia bacterium]
QECSMEVTSFKEDRLEGTITADRNNMDVLTTIPYDKGWHVLVDGEEVKTKKALDSLMTFEVDKGEHEIEMYYMSDSYKLGMTITVSGILLFVIACVGDAVIGKCIRRKKALRDGQALLAECADAETPDTDVYDEVLSESGSAEADTDAE